jgi:hypothetical protein
MQLWFISFPWLKQDWQVWKQIGDSVCIWVVEASVGNCVEGASVDNWVVGASSTYSGISVHIYGWVSFVPFGHLR